MNVEIDLIILIIFQNILSQYSFPGVTITDTSYLRGRMRSCYHTDCDSLQLVRQENIE